MATGRGTKLTGALGEFLVSAELCRRNLLATPFAGNVPHYDIIASGDKGGHLAVQVKAINGETWQFDIRKFVECRLDRRRQILGKAKPEPFRNLHVVLVALSNMNRAHDRFFVLPWKKLRDLLLVDYRAYLDKHGGGRPRSPGSFHTALRLIQVESFEDRWDTLTQAVGQDV